MPVAAFATIGSAAKEVLLGGKTEPAFQFDKKVTASVKAADSALSLAPTVVLKGDTADLSLKAAYSKKTYSADALFNSSNKVAVSCSVAELAPGVKVTGSITLPDTASGKLAVDYANQYLNLKATTSLSSAPVIDVVASTGACFLVLPGRFWPCRRVHPANFCTCGVWVAVGEEQGAPLALYTPMNAAHDMHGAAFSRPGCCRESAATFYS